MPLYHLFIIFDDRDPYLTIHNRMHTIKIFDDK
jgi:hypothetical protein